MKFSEAHFDSTYRITGYSPEAIWVNRQPYYQPIVITANQLLQPWEQRRFNEWHIAELEQLISLPTEILLIGTGNTYRPLPQELYSALIQAGKGFEIMDTAAACRTFNLLLLEARTVAAALFIN